MLFTLSLLSGLELIKPVEPKAVKAQTIVDLMHGVTEQRFWTLFVQCLECQQVEFREHYAINHRCPHPHRAESRSSKHRYHPFDRAHAHRPAAHAHLSTLIGDAPGTASLKQMHWPFAASALGSPLSEQLALVTNPGDAAGIFSDYHDGLTEILSDAARSEAGDTATASFSHGRDARGLNGSQHNVEPNPDGEAPKETIVDSDASEEVRLSARQDYDCLPPVYDTMPDTTDEITGSPTP